LADNKTKHIAFNFTLIASSSGSTRQEFMKWQVLKQAQKYVATNHMKKAISLYYRSFVSAAVLILSLRCASFYGEGQSSFAYIKVKTG